MKKRLTAAIALGKALRRASRLRGGGGSALPGLVIERLLPEFLAEMLGQLPKGVVVVTGTNGKTTTTKMITDILTGLGDRVLTNKTGSNFTRGVVASLVHEADLQGKLEYDIAVLELDEAHAKHFVKVVKPQYVVALNVMRDQLDRFGEIDTTARMIEEVLHAAQKGCVINRDDPHLLEISKKLKVPVSYYGIDAKLRPLFPTDEELLSVSSKTVEAGSKIAPHVELVKFDDQKVSYKIDGQTVAETLQVNGQHNFQNAAAALAIAQLVLPETSAEDLMQQLAKAKPAFGRGETLVVNGDDVELVLVKNPAGFRQALLSFTSPAEIMIAINDNYADGRDMSWLWDVDFTSLQAGDVAMVSGIRAYDMALRLQYEEVIMKTVEPELPTALKEFLQATSGKPKRIFCTYTAMLSLHNRLAKLSNTERAL